MRNSVLALAALGLVAVLAGCCDECEEPTCPDTVPPMAVTDLWAASVTDSSVTLIWTAPGDDGDQRTAAQYDIRYSTEEYSGAGWWDTVAVAVAHGRPPAPKVAGSAESLLVRGLMPETTYSFALKTADEVPNWSGLSNVVSVNPEPLFPPELEMFSVTAWDSNLHAMNVNLGLTDPGLQFFEFDEERPWSEQNRILSFPGLTVTAGNSPPYDDNPAGDPSYVASGANEAVGGIDEAWTMNASANWTALGWSNAWDGSELTFEIHGGTYVFGIGFASFDFYGHKLRYNGGDEINFTYMPDFSIPPNPPARGNRRDGYFVIRSGELINTVTIVSHPIGGPVAPNGFAQEGLHFDHLAIQVLPVE